MIQKLSGACLVTFSLAAIVLLVTNGCSESPPANSIADGPGPKTVDNPRTEPKSNGTTAPTTGDGPRLSDPDELFKGWPEPKLALFITGNQHGYVEPCGCTGLENQLGGLSRRHSFQQQLAKKGWEIVSLDAGNQVHRTGRQPEIKFQFTIDSLKLMNYAAIGFGPDDLRLSVDELAALTVSDANQSSPLLCANAAIFGREFTREFHVASAGGKKVGITAILGREHQERVVSSEVLMESPEEGLKRVWPKLADEKCDVYVLLAHASIEESTALAKMFPNFDLIATAGGAGEPTLLPEKIAGTKSIMIQVGDKGMYAGVVGVFDDATTPLRYQRVALSAKRGDSPQMLELFKAYQEQLRDVGLANLGVTPISHPSGMQFVGSETCQQCHDDEFKIWKAGPHAHATESLIHPNERSQIPRHFDPECLSCHVTGWNPQKFYPYKTGYLAESDKLLHGNGCENCHGPGSRHVEIELSFKSMETKFNSDERKQARENMQLTLAAAKESACYQCHDLDNSPKFQDEGAFEKYWTQIEH